MLTSRESSSVGDIASSTTRSLSIKSSTMQPLSDDTGSLIKADTARMTHSTAGDTELRQRRPKSSRYLTQHSRDIAVGGIYTISRSFKTSNNARSMCNMSGRFAWPGLQLNYFLHSSSSHSRMGDNSAISSYILWFFCISKSSTALLGGGIFRTVKSCIGTGIYRVVQKIPAYFEAL